jgi:ribosomal protein S1
LVSHIHPKHNLPVRTRVMTFSRQHHNEISPADSPVKTATKQEKIQQEITAKVLEFQKKAERIRENLKTVKLQATAAKKINQLNQDKKNENGRR